MNTSKKDQTLGDESKGTDSKRTSGGDKPAKPPRGLDRWFDDELNKLYVDVVNEPMPDDLARLVSQLKTRKAT